ncbi:unnamed protein product [Adineta steineri]|uniref:Beta-glucosidase n=1 Tax=Adineta steineri TaxID=433720 RepID=A0A813W7W1_9BILA|nr:unnamed protein product [Adineta steineri]CAF1434189.1 unnamed protein product [Adineta steineri]
MLHKRSRESLSMKWIIPILFFICSITYMYNYYKYVCKSNYDYPFQDPTLPIDIRLDNLMSLLTPEEKIDMLWMGATTADGELPNLSVPRLNIRGYSWMGQGYVYRSASNGCNINCYSSVIDGNVSVLPQGTGIASTWNKNLIFQSGIMISDESMAIQYNYKNKSIDYKTGASSVINIARDPRWGRVPETYGECPILTGEIAVAFNKGIMGYAKLEDTELEYGIYKVIPVMRHFVDYDGPDDGRFSFNAIISDNDLRTTYLPVWKKLIDEKAIVGVMSSISAVNGIPSAANKYLLNDVLRNEWNFTGYVISDCDPMGDIQKSFHYTATLEQAVAISVSSGNDINCGEEFKFLHKAISYGFVNFDTINLAIRRGLHSRFLSGNLDPIGTDPYSSIPYSIVDSIEHKLLTKQIVSESIVLLQNPKQILPFNLTKIKQIAVIGPSSNDITVQAHTYHGTPSKWITTLDGIQSIASKYNINVVHTWGASRKNTSDEDFQHAIELYNESDIILFVGGLDESFEEEDTDRNTLQLPGGQLELIKLLMKLNKPFAILIISGSPISEPYIINENSAALLWISYFGQSGDAIADILFGLSIPSGCLPFTIPIDTSQLLPIDDYSMNKSPGRTYRYLDYFKAPPLFPFGYGLTYSKFKMNSKLNIYPNKINNLDTDIVANINIINQGPFPAQFVTQLYYEFPNSTVIELPIRELLQFNKTLFKINEQKTISFTFRIRNIPYSNRQQIPGIINLWIGNSRDKYAQSTLIIDFDS